MGVDPSSASDRIALAVVMPVYNEGSNLIRVFEEWWTAVQSLAVSYRFFLIDDGSTDSTGHVLDEIKARQQGKVCVMRQDNQGHGRACRTGYDAAVESGAEYVLQVDSDGQCDPAFLPRFWALRNEVDCVFGRRVEREDGWMRGAISRLCSAAVGLAVGNRVGDVNVPYRLIRSDALARALSRTPKQFDMQNVALAVVLHKTPDVRLAEIPIHFRRRFGGESTLNVKKIAALGGNMLRQLWWLKN